MKYDDDSEFERYIERNETHFMTPFEQLAAQLGVLREKARHRISESPSAPPEWTIQALRDYDAQVNDAIRNAIGDDLNSFATFQRKVTDRIKAAFASGELQPNRCPTCKRIVMTPKARQCLWCGYDWHSA